MIFLNRVSRLVRWVLLIFVLLLAVLLSAVRVMLPDINQFRTEIVSSIGESIGKPIEMDGMTAGLNGIRPEVVLNGLRIIDPVDHSVLLRFDQLRAGLNVKEFLLTGNFQPRWVTIRGAALSVRRNLDGAISVVGLDSGEELPRWIFEDGQFELLDSEVDWQDRKHPKAGLHFTSADIRLWNANRTHKISIDVDLPQGYGKSLSIRMNLHGNLLLEKCCSGRIYAAANDIRYGRLLEDLSVEGYRVLRGAGGFRFWSTWKNSILVEVAGEMDLREAALSHEPIGVDDSRGVVDLRNLSGEFRWFREKQNWNLSVRRLALNLAGEAWPLTEFGLKRVVDAAAGRSDFYFTTSYLKLDDITRLLSEAKALVPVDHRLLSEISPGGELFDLKLGYKSGPDRDTSWFICARFKNIEFGPTQSNPGARNLTGFICGDRERGGVQLAASRAEIDLPKIFRDPIDLTTLQGDFQWDTDGNNWNIRSDRIQTVNPVFSADTRLFVQVPRTGGDIFLDLQTDFKDVEAAAAHRYLPVGILKKPLVEWLDSAFLSGTASRGGVLFRGPVSAFPFQGGEGVFETLFYTKDVELSYHPQWPVLRSEMAEVRFFQSSMVISGERADISGTSVEKVKAYCRDFAVDDYLVVTGEAGGRLRESIRFIRNSPLRPLYEPLLEFVSMHGENRIALELKVPIVTELDDILVDGTLALKNARLNAFGVQLERIYGELAFSRDWINGKRIRGVLLGSPVTMALSDNDRGLALTIAGSIDTKSIADRYPSVIWNYAAGGSTYAINLQIPKLTEKLYADIVLRSDLSGIAIDLPEPLGKKAADSSRFQLKTHLEPERDIPIDLDYGNVAQLDLNLANMAQNYIVQNGQIRIGRVPVTQKNKSGLSLYAGLERLDTNAWKRVLASLRADSPNGVAEVDRVDFQTARLMVEDADFGPLSLKMNRRQGFWEGAIQSTIASGKFSGKPGDPKTSGIDLTFEYLKIPDWKKIKSKAPTEDLKWDPGSIPDLNIKARHFFWKNIDYGSLELVTSRHPKKMTIDRLNIHGKRMDLDLHGSWTAAESIDNTSISGTMTIDNLGQFMTAMGKSNVVRDSDVRAGVHLKWKDPLYDLNFENLTGTAQVDFGPGRLLRVEPGIGRVFGLFNLDGLKNLLLFDFGKLFGKGLAFEEVKSSFLLANGHAKINRLTVDAVPADIIVTGQIDLVEERLDDIVTVVPKGVVAAGASMLLTQELPRSAVDGLINRQYQVTGKWDDPKIVRLPGSGKPL